MDVTDGDMKHTAEIKEGEVLFSYYERCVNDEWALMASFAVPLQLVKMAARGEA